MKNIFTLLLLAALVSLPAAARSHYTDNTEALPQAALEAVAESFDSPISQVRVDEESGMVTEYSVTLKDGTSLAFTSRGKLEAVQAPENAHLPVSIVPPAIRRHLGKDQPSSRIASITKDEWGYNVKLTNGLNVKYNRNGQFERYGR